MFRANERRFYMHYSDKYILSPCSTVLGSTWFVRAYAFNENFFAAVVIATEAIRNLGSVPTRLCNIYNFIFFKLEHAIHWLTSTSAS